MAGGCDERRSLASVNPSLTCALCKGYLVNAMTLIRCMHSFCKSCIHRHLDTSSACPTCQQRVFRSRMDLHMVPDTTLQSIVYKTVPGLYANEMRRRRDFFESREEPTEAVADKLACGEERGFPSRNIVTKDDNISLILEHQQDSDGSVKLDDRHLSCPAEIPVWVVLKFIRNKFSLPASLAVHLYLAQKDINLAAKNSKRGSKDSREAIDKDRLLLDPDLTLIDVCYIADYKFEAPIRLSFKFVQYDPTLSSRTCYDTQTSLQQRKAASISQNGVSSTTANGPPYRNGTVDYAKYKMDTKSIDMARGSLLNGGGVNSVTSTNGTNKSKTYSRASCANTISASLGHLPQLKSLPITTALSSCSNDNTGDSTEEEEADNWDSNVSTTIDRTLTTQQHQQQKQQSNNHLNQLQSSHPSTAGTPTATGGPTYTVNRPNQSLPSLTTGGSVSSAKHSKGMAPAIISGQSQAPNSKDDSRHHDDKNSPIVTRPQSVKVAGQLCQAQPMQQLPVSSLDNKVATPLETKMPFTVGNKQTTVSTVQQNGPVAYHKQGQGSIKAGHKSTASTAVENKITSHTMKTPAGPLSSPTSASASIVEGKSPTVLKIKLNIRPTTDALSQPSAARESRHSTALAIPSSSSTPAASTTATTVTYPKANKEYRSVTSIRIKPLVAPSGPVTRKTPSPPVNARDSRAAALDARKKRKLEEEARKLDEQKAKKAKKKLSSQAVINETPFIPVQHKDLLTTQSFGWGSASILWESQLRIPSPLIVPFTVSFGRRQRKFAQEMEQKQTPLSPTAKRLKPTPDLSKQDAFLEANFGLRKQPLVVKEPQNRIWRMRRHVSPLPVQVRLPPPDFVISPTLDAVLKAIARDNGDASSEPTPTPSAIQSEPKESPKEDFLETIQPETGEVSAGVFRMEFPDASGASANRETPAEPAMPSYQTLPERRASRSDSSEVKFSISSILSNDLGQKKCPPVKPDPIDRQPNIQEIIEGYLANLNSFFCALESCEPSVRASLQAACSEKKAVLIKILAILRNVSLSVVPAQSDKVLELAVLIQRHLLASDLVRSGGVQRTQTDTASPNASDGDTKKARRIYDINRNQLPLEGVPSCAEQKMTPPRPASESPGTSISTDPLVHTPTICSPAVVRQIPTQVAPRKPFQVQELLVKELASALKRIPPGDQEQKSAFELITIKRSSSVSSLNTSDGSENFGDGEVEPNRWEDVEVIPPPRPWPGCPSEV